MQNKSQIRLWSGVFQAFLQENNIAGTFMQAVDEISGIKYDSSEKFCTRMAEIAHSPETLIVSSLDAIAEYVDEWDSLNDLWKDKVRSVKRLGIDRVAKETDNYSTLTKREYFAGMAMNGIIASGRIAPEYKQEISNRAVIVADRILEELNKEET